MYTHTHTCTWYCRLKTVLICKIKLFEKQIKLFKTLFMINREIIKYKACACMLCLHNKYSDVYWF